MNSREMQESVEIELKQYDADYEVKWKLESRELFYYLSRSQRDYIQEIYDFGIDKNEENKKKLGSLFVTTTITGLSIVDNSASYPDSYLVTLPTDVMYVINERVAVTKNDTAENLTNIHVKPISYDEYSVNKNNPFRKQTDDKCLRLDLNNDHIIITSNALLTSVYLDYIKTPLEIDLTQDSELHESVHYNVVKGAVKLILASRKDQVGYNLQSIEGDKNK